MRSKKCKICGGQFVPRNALQKCCSMDCALVYAKVEKQKKQDKQSKAALKARKEKLKSKNDYVKEAQAVVNKYIRLRDMNKPCISCGVPLVAEKFGGGFDAGHYRSRGSAPHLRFYTLNIFGQCKRCNRYLGGNYAHFRVGLIERIGLDKVMQIEQDNTARHYSVDDLRRIKQIFSRKCKWLEKRRGL